MLGSSDIDNHLIKFLNLQTVKQIFLVNRYLHILIKKLTYYDILTNIKHAYKKGSFDAIKILYNDETYQCNSKDIVNVIIYGSLDIIKFLNKNGFKFDRNDKVYWKNEDGTESDLYDTESVDSEENRIQKIAMLKILEESSTNDEYKSLLKSLELSETESESSETLSKSSETESSETELESSETLSKSSETESESSESELSESESSERSSKSSKFESKLPEHIDNEYYSHFIQIAASFGHTNIIQYIHENGYDINNVGIDAICKAALSGYLDVIKYLHDSGVIINKYHKYALVDTIENNHFDCFKYLYDNGAKIDKDYEWDNNETYLKFKKYINKCETI